MALSQQVLARPLPSWAPFAGLRAWHARLSRIDRLALWVSLLGVPLRVAFVVLLHPPERWDYSDMFWYHRSALHFIEGSRTTDAFDWYYPSGTASAIAVCLWLFGPQQGLTAVGVLQALLNAAEVPLVYAAGRRLYGERVGLGAMLLFASHYLALGYAGLFMSESYLTAGLVLALWLFDPARPGRCLLSGLALGLGAWAKSQAFLLAPLWALWLLWRGRRWRPALAVVAGVAAVVLPTSVVASAHLHQAVLLSPNGGQTFALGQCPIRSIHYELPATHTGANFGLPDVHQRIPRGEAEASWGEAHYTEPFFNSGYYFREGLACIRRYPGHTLRSLAYHLLDTFAGPPWSNVVPWPESAGPYPVLTLLSNLLVAYLVAPLAFLGLLLRLRDERAWLTFALPIASLLASAVLFHGDPRFRVPYDFAFFLGACAAVQTLVERHRASRHAELCQFAVEP